jgi:hypothetical protein
VDRRKSFWIIETNFETVFVSERVYKYMSHLDKDWESIVKNKRKRGKHATFLRQKLKAIEEAAMILSAICYVNGTELKEI